MTNLFKSLLLSVAACFVATGCGSDSSGPENGGKPRIVATTTMLADMARQIVGDKAEVIGLMAPGVDPHTYELPARAIGQLNSADLVIYNGMLLEGKMGELIESLKSKGIDVFAAASVVPHEKLFTAEDLGDGHGDPHIWGDAELWSGVINPCSKRIAALFPETEHAEIGAQAETYEGEVKALHEWIKARIAEVPRTERLLVTSHDAFNYLGKAYAVEVVGVQGISTATDAGIADIVATVDLIKERKAKAVFVESSVSPATIERIAQDAGVKIGGELFSDSCGPSGEMEMISSQEYDLGTYIGMMKHNINTVVEALK
ncbi:MAG: metal ABC transporter solute-binding protein, Zn/Mn family [Verrucomicrobiales bacterium]